MDALFIGIFLPDGEIGFYVDLLHTVESNHIEFAHALVIFGRIARCGDEPAIGNLVGAEGFALQKLQHGRGQCFGSTVDFVNKKDALFQAGFLHFIVDRSDDLAHGVFCYGVFLAAVFFFADERQADGGLSGVVGDAVGNQGNATFPCHLFHNGSFPDTGGAHQ